LWTFGAFYEGGKNGGEVTEAGRFAHYFGRKDLASLSRISSRDD